MSTFPVVALADGLVSVWPPGPSTQCCRQTGRWLLLYWQKWHMLGAKEIYHEKAGQMANLAWGSSEPLPNYKDFAKDCCNKFAAVLKKMWTSLFDKVNIY